MELDQVIKESARFGGWAHVATVSPSGTPYVTPVHPAWHDDKLVAMVSTGSVKAKNVAGHPSVSVHWQVGESSGFDSLMLWGRARVRDDVETKREMWDGVFDFDLNAFAPGGPDGSPDTAFLEVTPTKAVLLRMYGMSGREVWRAG